MTAKKKFKSEFHGFGAAGSHRGRGLTPEDYEAMSESASGTLEELLGVSPEEAEAINAEYDRQVEQSERDIAAAALDARVNFRWGRKQVSTIKRAADLAGVPYQTYIKLVTYRQAIADIQAANAAGAS